MKNVIVNKNCLIVLSRRVLHKIELCNGLDLCEDILNGLCEKFGFPKKDKVGNIQCENVEYMILIGIDTDEVMLETIISVGISEELKKLPAYSFSLSQYYAADSIVDCILYLTDVAELEHKEWSDSLLLERILKDLKLNIDVLYEAEDEYSFEEDFIQSKRLKAIHDFKVGVSPLNIYLSPTNISDGFSHKIEISQDYKISSINLGGALGESVARFGDIATNTILRYFEESYKWHDHLILDVLVEQLNQTVNLCFKEHEQDLQRAMQHFLAAALRGEHPTDVEIESSSVHSIFSGKKSKYSNSDVKFLESFELLAASSDDKNPWFAQRIIANGDYIIDIQPYIKKPMEASISITAVPGREANLQTWLDAYRGQVVPISLDWNGIKIFEAKIRIDLEMVRADGNGRILQSERQSSGSKIDVKINNSDE